jgi:hypothetical protein
VVFQSVSVLTKRAAGSWDCTRFQAVFWAQAGILKAALSSPAHLQLTPAVGALNSSANPVSDSHKKNSRRSDCSWNTDLILTAGHHDRSGHKA